jgi:hypothetical protein
MPNNIAISKIAKLLRMPDESRLVDLFEKMEKITGKKNVAEKIYEENQSMVGQKLKDLGIIEDKADSQYVETELLRKTWEADEGLYNFLGNPNYDSQDSCKKLIEVIEKTKSGGEKGFFLKEEKMRDFLFLNPPQNTIKALGYKNIKETLEKENVYHVFAALRFAENERWLNNFFFRPYHDLLASSFEEREIKVEVLPEKWGKIGAEYVGKKLHHISHLKEAGIVFIIPAAQDGYPGQTLENFTLIFHYLYEVEFYSRIFRKYASLPDFGRKIVELLAANISSASLPKEGVIWRIIPRYLAKLNESDPRLFEPHINSEPLHWLKAESDIDKLAEKNPQIGLSFWRGVDDFVGEIFHAGKKGDDLVSFDLIDNLIFLSRGGIGKYLYHQQEALWNKIFIEFAGLEKMEEILTEKIDKGWVELK